MLQKELAHIPEVFGELIPGTPEEPAITKESVHYFFKYVSGYPLNRPAWYFDTRQQGEGIVDVTTHLVDLVQWECFPCELLSRSDVEIVNASRWPTVLSSGDFIKITGLQEFPDYLRADVKNDVLHVYANGEINYKLKDVYARVKVEWKYRSEEGTGDTHHSTMRGTKSNLIIKQGEKEGFKPCLYIELHNDNSSFNDILDKTIANLPWEGVSFVKDGKLRWKIIIPDKYKLGHEARFGLVVEKYLEYLEKGGLPEWELRNMRVKYHIISEALKLATE